MAILIKNILKRNNILRKILTIIIDNAFNNNIFIKSLIHYLDIKTLTSVQDISKIAFRFVNINDVNENINDVNNKD